jgi:hypothetical protein
MMMMMMIVMFNICIDIIQTHILCMIGCRQSIIADPKRLIDDEPVKRHTRENLTNNRSFTDRVSIFV